jgi:hypothetical protein
MLKRVPNGLIANNRHSQEELDALEIGRVYRVKISKPRNIKHHNLYWALCGAVAEQLDKPSKLICELIKIRVGHVDVINTVHGVVEIPKSIAFAKMDQAAFRDFFDRAIEVVCSDILPGVDSDDLRARVNEMLGDKQ